MFSCIDLNRSQLPLVFRISESSLTTMAPPTTRPNGLSTMVTRMKAAARPLASNAKTENNANSAALNKNNKRKADTLLTSVNKKRSAFSDLTNVS